jgi:orotate phosphoribosyltransferase
MIESILSVGTPLEVLSELDAISTDSHFVLTNGLHGRVYLKKDNLYPHVAQTAFIGSKLAELFIADEIDVVVSPAIGGVVLSQWTAFHLTDLLNREVLSTYAEREERSVAKPSRHDMLIVVDMRSFYLRPGEELVVKCAGFVLKRGYNELVAGKRVLIIEDILTTGGTVEKVVQATRKAGGQIVGVGALCNRGNVTAEQLDVPKLHSLINLSLETWTEEECLHSGPCSEGVPIDQTVGKGQQFMARQKL